MRLSALPRKRLQISLDTSQPNPATLVTVTPIAAPMLTEPGAPKAV
jgi:hypothetical protein